MERFLFFVAAKIMVLGMPVVDAYIRVSESIFLNTSSEDAEPLENLGNQLLSPAQYLLDGFYAYKFFGETEKRYELQERFDYEKSFHLKTVMAITLAPLLTPHGISVKALSYLFSETRQRHAMIQKAFEEPYVKDTSFIYRLFNIPYNHHPEFLVSDKYQRRKGDENHLFEEKECLKEVIALFAKEKIIYWADCGTCLGAYRYGGVIPWDNDLDIAILQPDFQRAKKTLMALDPNKYQVQDWSSRGKKDSYLKVYVKECGSLIDIYCFSIDPVNKTFTSIFSGSDNLFLPESWKARERKYTAPVRFDMIFPLKKGMLDGIEVFVPNQTKSFLQLRYGENIEPCHIFDENENCYVKDLSHPYWSD